MGKGIIEILHCKDCGAFLVVDIKKLYCTKECPTCGSREIEVWEANDDEEIIYG